MKTVKFLNNFLSLLLLVLSFNVPFAAQSIDNATSLQGISDGILLDGQPALKIKLGSNNNLTEVKFQQHDGEEALVYDVYKNQKRGSLYVTKTRLIFDPFDDKKNYLNIEKTRIKEVSLNKPLPGDRFVKINFPRGRAARY